MRKIQVNLNILRVNEETYENDAIRDEIHIYADANNLYEAVFAAVNQIPQYMKETPGVAVNSNLISIKEV